MTILILYRFTVINTLCTVSSFEPEIVSRRIDLESNRDLKNPFVRHAKIHIIVWLFATWLTVPPADLLIVLSLSLPTATPSGPSLCSGQTSSAPPTWPSGTATRPRRRASWRTSCTSRSSTTSTRARWDTLSCHCRDLLIAHRGGRSQRMESPIGWPIHIWTGLFYIWMSVLGWRGAVIGALSSACEPNSQWLLLATKLQPQTQPCSDISANLLIINGDLNQSKLYNQYVAVWVKAPFCIGSWSFFGVVLRPTMVAPAGQMLEWHKCKRALWPLFVESS